MYQSNTIDTGLLVCDDAAVFHLGDVIRKRRQQAKLSLIALAKKAGINKGTLSALERGSTNYRRETVERIASALGTNPYELARDAAPDRVTALLVELATMDPAVIEQTVQGMGLSPERRDALKADLALMFHGLTGAVGASAWLPRDQSTVLSNDSERDTTTRRDDEHERHLRTTIRGKEVVEPPEGAHGRHRSIPSAVTVVEFLESLPEEMFNVVMDATSSVVRRRARHRRSLSGARPHKSRGRKKTS